MATISDHGEIEKQLALELIRLNARIARLLAKKEGIEKLLIAHRADHLPRRGVIRKNAVEKVTTMSLIVDIMREARRPMKVSEILERVKARVPMLNDSTFRSYIHRLSQEGTIRSRGGRGSYAISSMEESPARPKPKKVVIRRGGTR